MRYVFKTRVAWVGTVTQTVGGYKDAETGEIMCTVEDRGWFVRFEGSQERMHIGNEEPLLKKGDAVKVTIEKV
jgi:hypothetical protein